MTSGETTFTLDEIKRIYHRIKGPKQPFMKYFRANYYPTDMHDKDGNELYSEA